MDGSLSVPKSDTGDNERIAENQPPARKLSTDGTRPSQRQLPHADAPSELADVVVLIPETVYEGEDGCCHREAEESEPTNRKPECGNSGSYHPQSLFEVEMNESVRACNECFPQYSEILLTLTPEGRYGPQEREKCWLCGETVPTKHYIAHLVACRKSVGETGSILSP